MTRQEIYYRPPSEEESFIVRVMHGCPHNKCTFCNLFKQVPLRRIPVEEVLAGIDRDVSELGPELAPMVKSMYLEGGDPLALRADSLVKIMDYARSRFPSLNRFACYATARFTILKSQKDLSKLARAGLRRVFVGLESGCDEILRATNKGCTSDDIKRAGDMLFEAGIEMDVSMMLGIGGQALSQIHARKTAELLNAIEPVCVRIRTFVAKGGSPMGNDYLEGRFVYMDPHDILAELRLMVQCITGKMQMLSEHWSDFIRFDAQLPSAKDDLLEFIDQSMRLPRSSFRPLGIADLKSKTLSPVLSLTKP